MRLDLDAIEARGRALLVFADGLEDAGHAETARRSRVVASDLLDVLSYLRAYESAYRTAKARHEGALALIVARGYEATRDSALSASGAGDE